MTAGFSSARYGVTPALIDSYGDVIFELSHNVQTRRGDPVRLKQFDAYERQRAAFGLSDGEIAERIGLTEMQVRIIRNAEERRRIQTEPYYLLNKLGGGKRFRPESQEQFVHPTPAGVALKAAMGFDPLEVRRYLEEGYWRPDTLSSWLRTHANERPDAPAIICDEETISYSQLQNRVDDLAEGFRSLGLGEADVVAVQLPNIPEHLIIYMALASLRAVMATLFMPCRKAEMTTLLGHSRARAFIGMTEIIDFAPAATALSIKDELPDLETVICLGYQEEGTVSYGDLSTFSPQRKRAPRPQPPVAADPMLLLYTSGTTASPKGVPLNGHVLLGNARLGAAEHGFDASDRLLSVTPFGHLFGLYSVHMALCVGAANVLLPSFSPARIAQTLKTHRPTALFATPAHIAACMAAGAFDRGSVASVVVAILSGVQVPGELVHAFGEILENGHVCQLWGMTEVQAGLYTRPHAPVDIVAGSAGQSAPGVDIRVVDGDGDALPLGAEGELQVRGPNLFSGYLNNSEANLEAFTDDGWFRTGDLARTDGDGNVSITGRSKDIINRGGAKYNPLDIERLLDDHPDVFRSAIVPMPDDVLGERAAAFVVPEGDARPTLNQLCDYLTGEGIARTKLPERLQLIKSMPLTPTQKIIKGQLIL
jgi:cyclohexanecarboxylate-CoA ligase